MTPKKPRAATTTTAAVTATSTISLVLGCFWSGGGSPLPSLARSDNLRLRGQRVGAELGSLLLENEVERRRATGRDRAGVALVLCGADDVAFGVVERPHDVDEVHWPRGRVRDRARDLVVGAQHGALLGGDLHRRIARGRGRRGGACGADLAPAAAPAGLGDGEGG